MNPLNIFSYGYAPILISVVVGLLALTLFFIIIRNRLTKDKVSEKFKEQLKEIYEDSPTNIQADVSLFATKKAKGNIVKRFIFYFGEQLIEAKMAQSSAKPGFVALKILLMVLAVYVIACVVLGNFGVALIVPVVIMVATHAIAVNKIKRQKSVINDQLLPFINMLKSNIQSGQTTERALIEAIESTNSPLYDELEVAKNLTEVGTFTTAIQKLREITSDPTLKFLCGCIDLSTTVGANLETELDTIINILKGKQKLQRQIDKSISDLKSLTKIAPILVIGLFFATYFMGEQYSSFWFVEPLSYPIFAVLIVVMLGGNWIASKLIKKMEEF